MHGGTPMWGYAKLELFSGVFIHQPILASYSLYYYPYLPSFLPPVSNSIFHTKKNIVVSIDSKILY